MASRTLGWCALVPPGMASQAICCLVGARQREVGGIVVKCHICISCWVTSQAGRVVVHISVYAGVCVVGFGVEVANSTRVFSITVRVKVTIGTGRPLPLVFAAVNREISGIMCRISCWCPVRVGRVALGAVVGEMGRNVVGRLGAVKIWLVAGITGIGGVGIVAAGVTLFAIGNFVSFGEREKIVVHFIRAPTGRKGIVAFQAIG